MIGCSMVLIVGNIFFLKIYPDALENELQKIEKGNSSDFY
jgi:hypothetical protein